ncbi:MAG: hypothetical protein GX585_05350, partial [Clostridiales bacterium]|nr:hypothetical protein [Clostridiales bacterium]
IRRTAKNKAGEPVVWAQAGAGMEAIGKIVIDPAAGAITSELVKGYAGKDGDMTAFIDGIMAEFQLELGVVVAQSEVALTCHDPATGERLIRRGETNLGDLCADAFRAVLEADIGLVNGGGIRGGIAIGEITKGDLLDVYTFSNSACLAEVTGRQLLDALEFGASRYPEESGGFLQVSGLSYTVDSTQPSSVVTNDRKEFVGVAGPYRVRDVMVGDRPLDPARTYTVAGNDYILKNSGDGYTMFGSNIRIVKDDVMLDSALLARYITETLGGRIGFDYADPYGQGRIVVLRDILFDFGDLDHTAWYAGAVRFCVERGLMAGAGEGRFVPNGVVTRGTVFQTLYNAEGVGRSPAEPSGRAGFSDVAGKWYEDAAHWAAQTGLAALPGDGRFHGDRPVTRAELATILARYSAWKGVDLSRGGTSMEKAADYDAIPGWALDGMSACFYNGIMTGKPGNLLDPNGGAVRTELATVLYQYGALAA